MIIIALHLLLQSIVLDTSFVKRVGSSVGFLLWRTIYSWNDFRVYDSELYLDFIPNVIGFICFITLCFNFFGFLVACVTWIQKVSNFCDFCTFQKSGPTKTDCNSWICLWVTWASPSLSFCPSLIFSYHPSFPTLENFLHLKLLTIFISIG